MAESANKKNMTFLTKLGYGFGTFCRHVENFFGVYMILYLTTVAGISPGTAGTMFSIALTIGAITTVVVGYLSDNSTSPKGKRRPYMIAFLIPLTLTMFLFFAKFDFSGNLATVFYGTIAILIYICFNGFLIPYESLGAELTEEYNDRSTLRTINSVFLWLSIFICASFSMTLIGILGGMGIAEDTSWLIVGGLIAATLFIGGIISIFATKGREVTEPVATQKAKREKGWLLNIFKTYFQVLKIKQTRLLVIWDFIFFVGQTMLVTGTSYFILYVLGVDEAGLGQLMSFQIVFALIGTAFANIISKKVNKKTTLLISMFIFIIGLTIVKLLLGTSLSGFAIGVIFQFFFSFAYGMVLVACFAMIYDSAEINEYVFGDNMIAATVGVFVFVMTIAVAVGNWIIGQVLQFAGFDGTAAVQPEAVSNIIANTETLIPVAIILVSTIVLFFYKINNKNHSAIVSALEAKREGREYSEEDFKEIL